MLHSIRLTSYTTLLLFFLILTFFNNCSANTIISIEITNLKKLHGKLYYQVFTVKQASSWSDPVVDEGELAVNHETSVIQLNNLDPGEFAIRIFQDLNGNEKLDLTAKGRPKEPVGFSQNPSLFGHEPDISKCAFNTEKQHQLTIKLRSKPDKIPQQPFQGNHSTDDWLIN